MPGPINQDTKPHASYLVDLGKNAVAGYIGGWICFAAEGLKKRAQTTGISPRHFLPTELFRGSTAFAGAVMVVQRHRADATLALSASDFSRPSARLPGRGRR